jgi:hypothetical protein
MYLATLFNVISGTFTIDCSSIAGSIGLQFQNSGGKFAGTVTIDHADTGIQFLYGPCPDFAGSSITINSTVTTGISISYMQGLILQHTATTQLINIATTKLLESATPGNVVNPFIWVTDTVNKYFEINYTCGVYNQSDCVSTGTVSYTTTASAVVMTGASTWTPPKCQPWQVLTWGTFTVTKSGAGAPTYEYQVSSDGGTTWGALVAINSGDTIAAIPNGNGYDAIRFKVTLGSSTTTLTSISITNNVYDQIAFSLAKDYMVGTGRKIKSIGTNRWVQV